MVLNQLYRESSRMVQIIPANENANTASQFAQAMGQGLGTFGQAYTGARQKAKEHARDQDYYSKLTGGGTLSRNPELAKIQYQEALKGKKTPQIEAVKEALIAKGYTPEDAELYINLTQGGQTAFAKDLLEKSKRSGGMDPFAQQQEEEDEEQGFEEGFKYGSDEEREAEILKKETARKNQSKLVTKEIKDFVANQDEGLTPSEKVRRSSERYKTGLPVYQEAHKKERALRANDRRFDEMTSLNKSKKLPEGLERLNIDWDGNLILPSQASPEAQRYVKILNEFSENAKDSYGSRVTNFDLQQFFKRYPTLLNSEEGRKQLLDHMKIVNDIDAVYYKNLQKVYKDAGGARNIDADVAQEFAERMSEPKVEKLTQKLKDVGTFSSLPSASEFKGQEIEDEDTGERFISDGTNWIPQGG